jgi:hypothetical protein
VDTTDPVVQQAAHEVVNEINGITRHSRDKCEELLLEEIKDARIVVPNEQVLPTYVYLPN